MDKINYFIGIDISKEKFDAVFLFVDNHYEHRQFENSVSGCKAFIKWIDSFNIPKQNCLFCAEHTGLYVNILANYLVQLQMNLWLEMSYRIIHSGGLQRGKTDKIDALRIALYAKNNADRAIIYQPSKNTLVTISALLKLREKFIRQKASLKKTVQEYKTFDPSIAKILTRNQSTTIKGMEKDLKKIDNQIDSLVKEDANFNALYTSITSVPSIGRITALTLICITNEFKKFDNPRKLACYCGVVPFEHSSGKSIKQKPKVHFMANKQAKQLLHMCALTAAKNDPELKLYFTRKVAEGKSKMLVINNIRNKLIHRIYACVKNNRTFIPNIAA